MRTGQSTNSRTLGQTGRMHGQGRHFLPFGETGSERRHLLTLFLLGNPVVPAVSLTAIS